MISSPLAGRLGVVLTALAVLWTAGGLLLFRDLHARQAARTAEAAAAVNGVVEEARLAVIREARLVAQDPAIAPEPARGDWTTVARGASPRLIALTVERVADLLVIADATGTTLAQMPSAPRVELPGLVPPPTPMAAVRVLTGRAWLLGLAPIHTTAGTPVGVAVVGQRVDRLERGPAGAGARPTIVALAGDRAVGAARPDVPTTGWAEATREGTVMLAGEPWAVRPLAQGLSLWVLVPEGESRAERARLWVALLSSFAVAATTTVVAAGLGRGGPAGPARVSPMAPQARRTPLAALLEINKKIGAAESTEALLTAIAEEAARLLAVDNAGFRLVEGEELVVAGLAGTAGQTMQRPRIKIGESFSGRVVKEGRSLMLALAESPGLIPEHRDVDMRLGYTHFLGVPLRAGDRIIGVLAFRARRRFTPRDLELAEAFAGQAALALEQARLHREAQRHAERMRALADVERLSAAFDPDGVAQRIVDSVRDLLKAQTSVVFRLEPGSDELVAMAVSGEVPPIVERAGILPPGTGAAGLAVRARRSVVSPDVLNDPTVSFSPHLRERLEQAPYRSVLAIPLRVHDRVIGALGVADRLGRVFDAEDVRLAEAFADRAALALEDARLFSLESARRAQIETLAEVERELAAELSLDRLLRLVIQRASELFGAEGVVYLVEGESTLVSRAWSEGAVFDRRVPFGHGAAGACAAERRGLLVNDYPGSAYALPEAVAIGVRRLLAHPLVFRDRVLGVIRLSRLGEAAPPFTLDDLAVLESFASQAVVAIQNARLYAEAQERLRETTTLLAVGQATSQTVSVKDEMMRRVAREVARAIGADMVGAWALDPGGAALVPIAGYRVPEALRPWFATHPMILARVPDLAAEWRAGRSIWSADPHHDERFDPEWIGHLPPLSVLFAPTPVRGESVGALFVVWWGTGRQFPPAEIRLIEGVAAQVGLALEHAELIRQRERRMEELSVLHTLSQALTGQLDRQVLLDALRGQVPRVLAADRLVVLLVDDTTDEMAVALHVGEEGNPHSVGLASVVLATGRPLRSEDYGRDCEGRGIPRPAVDSPSRWLGVPMMAADRVLGVLALSRHQTPFTDAEERLATNIADLAALALRSASLYEERARAYSELAAAQDHLVRTEKLRALGEMASGVAHDFNNLLAAILGRAQLLLRHLQDPGLRQWLQVIERSALDGAQTVRRLQEFARVRRDEPLMPVDLNEVARDALKITQSRWRDEALRRGITIEVETDLHPVPRVAGDPAELREAMTNLILNAVDAMPNGGTLSITSALVEDHVEVAVTDTGTGMPAEIREKIFDPFFTTKGPQGTGLGLSMTYGIVSRHGARITVDSEEGRGSSFRLLFPLGPAAALPGDEPAATVAVGGALRCLVVDDEEPVGSVIGDVLETLGHRAVVLTDGAQAIDRLRAEPFDIVFTDLAMPGVSGWKVARAAKEVSPQRPVFVVTGFDVQLSPEERRAHGVEAIYSKPLKIEDVMDAVAQAHRARARGDRSEGT